MALVTVAAALAFGAGPGAHVATASDPSSDIPGIDLPGAVAAGRLGGAIYDVVYHLTVPPGYVIVASLTGTAGTDFDLYLFDATATTVQSDTGLLTKSIGSTSTESITWPSRSGGTYYIDLNGATDLEGDYRLTVQTVPDPTPPVVSVVLAGGRASTNQLTIAATLTASDDLSGVSEMAFSGDGSNYTAWQPFARTATWTFGPGDGRKTLWVKVKNGVGLESAPATASVNLDTLEPSAIAVDPLPGATVVGLRPLFRVVFDEPMIAATWTNLGLIVQSAGGELVGGVYAYDAATRTGTFVPSGPLVPGTTYVVTLGDVTDLAGNRVAPRGSWTVVPIAPTELEVRVSSHVIVPNGSVRFDVSLAGAPAPATIQVLGSPGGATAFVPVATIDIVNGRGLLVVTPNRNTTYRFDYPGAFGVASATVEARILVRRSIVILGSSTTVASRAHVGSSVKLTAAIAPAAAGVSVSFRLYRYDSARRTWLYAGSNGRKTDAKGQASLTWAPSRTGTYYWRAWVGSTADFANNVSPVYRWTVSR